MPTRAPSSRNRSGLRGLARFVFDSINSFVSPRICEICGEKMNFPNVESEYVCPECLRAAPALPNFDSIKNELFSSFSQSDLAIYKVYALMKISADAPWFGIIRSLKYRGVSKIGYEFGGKLGAALKDCGETDYDAVAPIPIHGARRRERGYNQSELIALGLAEAAGLRYEPNLLRRTKYTTTQTKLGKSARRANVEGVFVVSGECPKRVLLVDDVLTTGATLNSAAEALLDAGATLVSAAAIAKA